jgi:hypothetical protein
MVCPWDPRGEGSSFPDRTFVDQKTRVHFFRRAQPKVRSYYEERVITEHLVPIPTLRPNNSPPSPRQIRRFDVIEQVCLAAPLNRSSWINSPGEGTRPASSSPASAATILSALAKGGLSRTHWSIPTWQFSHRRDIFLWTATKEERQLPDCEAPWLASSPLKDLGSFSCATSHRGGTV